MRKPKINHSDKLLLECLENGKTLEAELLEYKHGYSITCSVQRQVKVYLRYNDSSKKYVGRVGSLEFSTQGPRDYNF